MPPPRRQGARSEAVRVLQHSGHSCGQVQAARDDRRPAPLSQPPAHRKGALSLVFSQISCQKKEVWQTSIIHRHQREAAVLGSGQPREPVFSNSPSANLRGLGEKSWPRLLRGIKAVEMGCGTISSSRGGWEGGGESHCASPQDLSPPLPNS